MRYGNEPCPMYVRQPPCKEQRTKEQGTNEQRAREGEGEDGERCDLHIKEDAIAIAVVAIACEQCS